VVVAEIDGVIKDTPVPIATPPLEAVYQLIVPALAEAPKVTTPASQRVPGVVPVIVGVAFTVAVTAVLGEDIHPL
jgi:hypothetical protein